MEITLNKPKMQVFQVENENTKVPPYPKNFLSGPW
jgi:hypothetical protein